MKDLSFSIQITAHRRRLVFLREFRLCQNRITLLLGESGIGKSLVARSLYGLIAPDDFAIRINNVDYTQYLTDSALSRMRERGFFVFQEPSSHLNPLLTVREQLHEGSLARWPDPAGSLRQLWDDASSKNADKLLEIYPKPYRPSGGEKQRVLLAMALSKIDMLRASQDGFEGGIFIFDEPTGSLDNRYRDRFLAQLLKRYRKGPFTVLFITHDYSLIRQIATEHRDVMPQVDFRELASVGGELVLREFKPTDYSAWLDSLARVPGFDRRAPSQLLLALESGLEVFGRQMEVTADAEGFTASPLKVYAGRLSYLKAPSGTGKTTVSKAIMGLVPAQKMQVALRHVKLTDSTGQGEWRKSVWGRTMTMVFQHADEALNMHSTVEETLRQLPVPTRKGPHSFQEDLSELFDRETIPTLLKKKVWMLSGGQKQKLNLLRGLILNTEILVLDEPLNGLDFESCTRVVDLLQRKCSKGMGILVISHNEEIFDTLSDVTDRYYLHVRPSVPRNHVSFSHPLQAL